MGRNDTESKTTQHKTHGSITDEWRASPPRMVTPRGRTQTPTRGTRRESRVSGGMVEIRACPLFLTAPYHPIAEHVQTTRPGGCYRPGVGGADCGCSDNAVRASDSDGTQAGGDEGRRVQVLRTSALPFSALHRLCIIIIRDPKPLPPCYNTRYRNERRSTGGGGADGGV